MNSIEALSQLGTHLKSISTNERDDVFKKAKINNPWFTEPNLNLAWQSILRYLTRDDLNSWWDTYKIAPKPKPRKVGIIAAGNLPLVSFHDILCTWMAGHEVLLKMSSQDQVLWPFILEKARELKSPLVERIQLVDRLNEAEAVIATGSDNSSRYFNYYFQDKPHIIRKNRSSCAILDGKESVEDLEALSHDIFQYFGLGCRNVSKLFIPRNFDYHQLSPLTNLYPNLLDHHKYANNFYYRKSIFLVNQDPFWELENILIKESREAVSPIGVLYIEQYSKRADLDDRIAQSADKIQCVVSREGWFPQSLAFGTAQQPGLNNYADQVDTLEFLLKL